MRRRSLSLLADLCASTRQLQEVHVQMLVSGRLLSDHFAFSRLLSSAALHHLSYALSLFSHYPLLPTPFIFNTLIRALAASSSPFAALRLYSSMCRLGVRPNTHTFPFALKAAANSRSLSSSRQLHSHVLKHGFDWDPYAVNGLVRCYCSGGVVEHARKMFDGFPRRNLMLWTTMICGYAQNYCANEAIALFDEMMCAGVEPCGPTLASVLSACARAGGLELGRRIHSTMKENKGLDLRTNVILGTALVDMYAKNGEISSARKVFDEMLERNRNTAAWNAMIGGLARHGHAEEALELFRELEKVKTPAPNDTTFVAVLTACCHTGLIEYGRNVFNSMTSRYSIHPKVEHYSCMVNMLGRSGQVAEAEELIRGMKTSADIVVWGALLTACKAHGEVEVAERVVAEMLKLDPGNHGVYVILSNMYAEAGRWGDVVRLRRVMKDEGLKKIAGWSCVNGDEG